MAHRVGVIAWGSLDKAIDIQMDKKTTNLKVTYDRKKGMHFSKTMMCAIEEFLNNAPSYHDEYNMKTWDGCHNYYVAVGAGASVSNKTTVITAYIFINLYLLNPSKYNWFFNSHYFWSFVWHFQGHGDGSLPEHLGQLTSKWFTNKGDTLLPLTREMAEEMVDLCKTLFKSMVVHVAFSEDPHDKIDAEYIEYTIAYECNASMTSESLLSVEHIPYYEC